MQQKRIAVIGGGVAGISSCVQLKEEGFEPVCFERSDRYGGTWSTYRQESEIGTPSTMPTTVMTNSKEMGAFSDFPPRKEFNNYMRLHEANEYITEYATAKDVMKHLNLNMEVIEVKKASDYDETGRWDVSVKDRLSGAVSEDTYDGVVVCVGQFNLPFIPEYPNQGDFKGKIMHSHSLKGVQEFQGKNVVVVGMGCSALDAAVEISSVAKQVYLSARSSTHITSRIGPQGYPTDYIFFRRYFAALLDIFPVHWCSWLIQSIFSNFKFHQNLYPVPPTSHILAKDPVINDGISFKIMSGAVRQVHGISRFTETGVIFDEENGEIPVDVVIMATGYTWNFPFLEKGILNINNDDGKINLYKCIFPTQLKHATLAFISFFLIFGPFIPAGELQCRYMAQVFAKHLILPSKRVMMKDVDRRHKLNSARFAPSSKTSIRVDYIHYMDEIASLLGVKPNFAKLFFSDVKLFWKLVFGPCVSYQYRLEGPRSWEGAREAIMTVNERIHWPLRRHDDVQLDSSFERWFDLRFIDLITFKFFKALFTI